MRIKKEVVWASHDSWFIADRAKYLNSLPVLWGTNYRFAFKGKQRKAFTHRVTVKQTTTSPSRHCINNILIEVHLRYETTNTYHAHYQINVNWTINNFVSCMHQWMNLELWWNDSDGERSSCPTQIQRGQAWDRTLDFEARRRRLTTRVTARLCLLYLRSLSACLGEIYPLLKLKESRYCTKDARPWKQPFQGPTYYLIFWIRRWVMYFDK